MIEISKGNSISYDSFKPVDDLVLESEIKKIISQNPTKNKGALMGIVMAQFKGKADGKKIMEILTHSLS